MSLVVIGGNNRGGKAIVNELQDETTRLYEPAWLLVDQKVHRAAQMATVLKHRFPTLQPQPLQMKAQDSANLLRRVQCRGSRAGHAR